METSHFEAVLRWIVASLAWAAKCLYTRKFIPYRQELLPAREHLDPNMPFRFLFQKVLATRQSIKRPAQFIRPAFVVHSQVWDLRILGVISEPKI